MAPGIKRSSRSEVSVIVTDVSSPLWRTARWWNRVVHTPLRVELHVVVRHDTNLEVMSAPLNPVG